MGAGAQLDDRSIEWDKMVVRAEDKGIMTKKTPSFLSGSHMQNHALLRSVCSDRHGNWWELTG